MATIVMESYKVSYQAREVIHAILTLRMARDEKIIAHAMSLKRFSLFRGFYHMDRTESINWINCQYSWGFSEYADNVLDHAKKLLKLSELGNPVTLNENDVAVLYFKVKAE